METPGQRSASIDKTGGDQAVISPKGHPAPLTRRALREFDHAQVRLDGGEPRLTDSERMEVNLHEQLADGTSEGIPKSKIEDMLEQIEEGRKEMEVARTYVRGLFEEARKEGIQNAKNKKKQTSCPSSPVNGYDREAPWDHQKAFDKLQRKFVRHAQPRLIDGCTLFGIDEPEPYPLGQEESSVAQGSINVEYEDPSHVRDAECFSTVPESFPPFQPVSNIVDMSTYLASSKYIVSLGGPPAQDLKYGIFIVPAGDESLLFEGYGDKAAMSPEMIAQARASQRAAFEGEWAELRSINFFPPAYETKPPPDWDLDDDLCESYRAIWLRQTGNDIDFGESRKKAKVEYRDMLRERRFAPPPRSPSSAPTEDQNRAEHEERADAQSVKTAAGSQRSALGNSEVARAGMSNDGVSGGEDEAREAGPSSDRVSSHGQDDRSMDSRRKSCSSGQGRSDDVPPRPAAGPAAEPPAEPPAEPAAEPAPSTPTTLQSPATPHLDETLPPLSTEALQVLERVFVSTDENQGRSKIRTSARRKLGSLLGHRAGAESPAIVVPERKILLEVATAVRNMASSEKCENPGIDNKVWEVVQRQLALKAGN